MNHHFFPPPDDAGGEEAAAVRTAVGHKAGRLGGLLPVRLLTVGLLLIGLLRIRLLTVGLLPVRLLAGGGGLLAVRRAEPGGLIGVVGTTHDWLLL